MTSRDTGALVIGALVSAMVAAATTLLLAPGGAPAPAPGSSPKTAPGDARGSPAADGAEIAELRAAVARLEHELRRLRAAQGSTPGADAGTDGAPPPAGTLPAGSPAPMPTTAEELEALIDARIRAAGAADKGKDGKPRRSLDEAADELGLTSLQREAARRIQRETEQEFLSLLFGTTDLAAIRRDMAAVAADPDAKATFVQSLIGNAISNAGRLMTLEGRHKAALDRELGTELSRSLRGYELRPVFLDEETERIVKEALGD